MKNTTKNGNRIALATLLVALSIGSTQAQIRIGPGSMNGSTSLDVWAGPYPSGSVYRGLLPPTVTTTQRGQIQNPATGLLVFNTTTSQIEVNTGTTTAPVWTPGGAAGTGAVNTWRTTGNTGTVSSTNFIGTADNMPLNFRVNNINAGRIDAINSNVALGFLAFSSGATGQGNTAFGTYALANNTSSNYNTATGFQALYNNTTGNYNTATGTVAMLSNTTGEFNVASGYKALYSNVDGSGNTAIGSVTLQNNTSGHDNAALGQVALNANTTGSYNTAAGAGALQKNTAGYGNTALGHNSMVANTTGYANIGTGEDALIANIDGHDNVALGNSALLGNTSGNGNVASGNLALYQNTTGTGNTASGVVSMRYNTTGSYNTALGYAAGPSAANPAVSNSTALGANAVVSASNQIVLGDFNISSLRCNVQTISSLSDKRIKDDIQANVPGLRFITKLTPVTYHVNKVKEAKLVGYSPDTVQEDKVLHSGFLAQDVEAAAKAAGYNFEGVQQQAGGGYYTLGYTLFVMPLVAAVNELNAEVETLKARLQEHEDLKAEVESLKARLEKSASAQTQVAAQISQMQLLLGLSQSGTNSKLGKK